MELCNSSLILIAFLVGSIPSGYLLAKLSGVDIKKQGSGNIGATNVARVLGKRAGVLTLILDIAKGLFVVTVLPIYLKHPLVAEQCATIFGLAAIVGHCFSPFMKFNGGKGVATSLGVFSFLAPIATLVAAIVFVVTVKLTRFVSLGSILASLALFSATLFTSISSHLYLDGTSGAALIASLIIIGRHEKNIRRLIKGEENRI